MLECFRYFIIHFALISFFLKSEYKKEDKYFPSTVGGQGKWSLFLDISDYEFYSDSHVEQRNEVSAIKRKLTPKLQL